MFNKDFYPTPKALISQMKALVDFRTIKTVLEPSAGKGDIVDTLKQYNSHYNILDVDVVESELELQHILRGKNYRLVHDDFLSYSTYKKYDLIIMNPPFSNGDKHLAKAISMIEPLGGQIVCVLNAETLRNPYTNSRKKIVEKLKELKSEIIFKENAFEDGERKTLVDIAIVNIKINKESSDSIILDHLKNSFDDTKQCSYNSENSIIHGDFISGLIEQCNFEISCGIRLINDFTFLNKNMFTEKVHDNSEVRPTTIMTLNKSGSNNDIDVNCFIRETRLKYWKALFSSEEFEGLLTENLRTLYNQKISELRDYEFSFFNISQIKYDISLLMADSLDDTILRLFDQFSQMHSYSNYSTNIHLYDGWKTNKSWKINHKVIIPFSAVDSWNNTFRYNYTVTNRLKDIEKVFDYLNGTKSNHDELLKVLNDAELNGQSKKIEFKYFYITFYLKGTTHIQFKDMKLLDKLNIFGSQKKGWLPPSYGFKDYKNMDDEEKTIIDAFQGMVKYQSVYANPSKYIFNASNQLKLTA